ncbi:PAS domain-containing protein [Sediminicola sp. 1XM1-17]|uniref:PAS domain-containing protein n=1 Tax=Sediminicola sp. 1XM1-17 TaxID=3127702 RepID=UPI00307784D3
MIENQLFETELLQSIFDSTSEGILVTDKAGRFLKGNKAAFNMLGINGKKMEQQYLGTLLSPNSQKILSGLLENKDPRPKKQRLQTNNGFLDIEIKLIHYKKDRCIFLLRDISLNKVNRKSLEMRNMALEAASNGIVISDAKSPDLPIIYCNSGLVKMTGYSKNEILGKNCRFLQATDKDQKEIKFIRSALKNGEPCRVVLRNYKKDGTLFWNELNITPVYNESQELCYFIGVQNDVTLAKREELNKDRIRDILELITKEHPIEKIGQEILGVIEENIAHTIPLMRFLDKEHERWYQLPNSSIPKGILETMANLISGTFRDSNDKKIKETALDLAEDMAHAKVNLKFRTWAKDHGIKGYWSLPIISSQNKLLGNLLLFTTQKMELEPIEKENLDSMVKLVRLALDHHQNFRELQQSKKKLMEQAKDLEARVVERTKEVTATIQKLVEVNLSLEDQIKETKEAEDKAKQSRAMLSAIAQNLPKGAIVVFNSNYEIVYVEGEELKHINLVKEEVEGRSIDEIPFFSDHQISKIKQDIRATLQGKRFSFEMGFEKKIYAVNSRPLYDANQGHVLALFVYNNITQQKRVEREIRFALKKEQELNDLKSRFVSMASHEFRTPLSAILSSAILIDKQNNPGNEDKIEKYVERIKSNVKSLVVILNDFLSLDKLEEGKVLVHPQLFDLVQFVKTLIEEMETNKKKGQSILFSSKEEGILVFVDPKLLSHVLINLLSNAIKYSEDHQEILLSLEKNGPSVLLKITDFGIGIPIKEQEFLFDRFFRAENVVNIQGTGLGLHIVRQYVELMGGNVSFKSELGKETIFTVELPTNLNENENNTDHRG